MIIVRIIIALIIFAVVSAVAQVVCRHFGIDTFWGWLVGVAAGLWYFFAGPDYPRRTVV